ncbi:MAG: adenosine deaminase [Planctomycetota bacterium]
MSAPSEAELRLLPKIDLHLHLDGAVRVRTILELAQAHGVPLPADTVEGLAPHVLVPPDCGSLARFLKTFDVFYPVLRFPDAMTRVAREACEDAARENVIYLEARFCPLLQEAPGFPLEAVLESVLEGLRQGMEATGVRAQVILCCYRPLSGEGSLRVARLALAYRERGVCGLDLAGDERAHPIGPHAEAFSLARKADLPITIHAGEDGGPQGVREAVEVLGARRIGHGTRAARDEGLLDLLARRGVALEVCLTSNAQTGTVKRLADHPLPLFLDRGVRATINTDDPAVSGITLTHEYRVAMEELGFELPDLEGLGRNAARAAFLPEADRRDLEARIRAGYPSTDGDDE